MPRLAARSKFGVLTTCQHRRVTSGANQVRIPAVSLHFVKNVIDPRLRCQPDDGIVADDPAGSVVERAHDRPRRLVGEVELRAQAPNLVGQHDARVNAEQLIDLCALLHRVDRAVRVRQRQMPVLREHQVEVEIRGQLLVQLHALRLERRTLGCAVVRTDDGRVATGGTRADVRLLEDGDVYAMLDSYFQSHVDIRVPAAS